MWETWKKSFDTWENATAKHLENALTSDRLLAPSAATLAVITRVKAVADRLTHTGLGALGLATKRDQERTLHMLNKLESRLIDLEEQLQERSSSLETRK
jgi:hypothetical protein